MMSFPNPEFPISSADCAEIESIFIELMRAREATEPVLPFSDLPRIAPDLRSEG